MKKSKGHLLLLPTCRSHHDHGTSSSRSHSSARWEDACGMPAVPDVALNALGTSTPRISSRSLLQTSKRQQQELLLPRYHPLVEKQKQQKSSPQQHWQPVPRQSLKGSSHMAQRSHSCKVAAREKTTADPLILKLWEAWRESCACDGSHRRYWQV